MLDFEALADIPVEIEVRLGCRNVTLDEMARLEIGDTIRLGIPEGTSLDVFAGNVLLASAEPVVLVDRLGIRINDLVTGPLS